MMEKILFTKKCINDSALFNIGLLQFYAHYFTTWLGKSETIFVLFRMKRYHK